MQKLFRVTVDISKKIPAPAFEVNTNDLKSVKLEITITNGQSLLDLTDVTPRINIRKPDNEVIFQDCEIVDAKAGKVQIVLENQAYLVPGTHTAEIACYKGNEITAITGTFSYKSVKGIMNDKAVESKSEFTAINRTLNEAERILEDLRENGGGAGVDQQARQKIEEVTEQLADTVKEVNGVKPTDGKVTIPVPEIDTSNLATKTELQAVASGAPKAVSRVSEMTDNTKNYVYTGNETGYTSGNWYYHNGTAWVSGGVYQATGIARNDINFFNLNDTTQSLLGATQFDIKARLNWEYGSVNSTNGTLVENNIRIRTKRFYASKGTVFRLPSNVYSFSLFLYSPIDKTYQSQINYATNTPLTTTDDYIVIVSVKKSDNTTITEVELQQIASLMASDKVFSLEGLDGKIADVDKKYENQLKEVFPIKSENISDPLKKLAGIEPVNLLDKNNWEFGGISFTDGSPAAGATRIRSKKIYAPKGSSFSYSSANLYNYIIGEYSLDGTYITYKNWTATPSYVHTLTEDRVIQIVLRKPDNSNITEAELNTMISLMTNNPVFLDAEALIVGQKQKTANIVKEVLKNQDKRFNKANFLGDSNTFGQNPVTNGARITENFPKLTGDFLGISVVNNYGVSGSTLGSLPDQSRNPMTSRYANMDNNADLIFVMGGTNDERFGVPLGTLNDNTDATYYGALKILADGLITKYPTATIVFSTPLQNNADNKLKDYRNAVIEVCGMYSIPVFDAYTIGGVYPRNEASRNALMPDGTHMNEVMHKKFAYRVSGFLKNL